MLLFLFRFDEDRFAVAADRVEAVLPLVEIGRAAGLPAGVAGVINWRGAPVPVVDLVAVLAGRPAQAAMSTRLLVCPLPLAGGRCVPLALMVENATGLVRRPRTDFVASGIRADGTPYLGPVAPDAEGVVQLVDPVLLLPQAVLATLYDGLAVAGAAS
ncbi:chemotaxis protein CheW [Pseudoxanthobacter sp.]|uniref:chemotaxis protein CheW n=1 Tax=Pseudoxanthobacter sp. TaxID=1925742 RepID=UPI002FE1B65E